MIYKVFANCVKAARPNQEISEEEAHNLIIDHLSFKIELLELPEDANDEDINDYIEKFYDAGLQDFKKRGFYGCGDFDIIVSDTKPARPNKAGDDMPDLNF